MCAFPQGDVVTSFDDLVEALTVTHNSNLWRIQSLERDNMWLTQKLARQAYGKEGDTWEQFEGDLASGLGFDECDTCGHLHHLIGTIPPSAAKPHAPLAVTGAPVDLSEDDTARKTSTTSLRSDLGATELGAAIESSECHVDHRESVVSGDTSSCPGRLKFPAAHNVCGGNRGSITSRDTVDLGETGYDTTKAKSRSTFRTTLGGLRSTWFRPTVTDGKEGKDGFFVRSMRRTKLSSMEVARQLTGESTITHSTWRHRFLYLQPDSLRRLIWDLLSVVTMCYDLVLIPWNAVFGKLDTDPIALNVMIAVFWTLDIILSFLTGYHKSGLVEMRPKAIARNYLRKWFVMDLLVVAADWTLLLIAVQARSSIVQTARIARVSRLVRISRAARVLRFGKFTRVFSGFFAQMKSDQARSVFSIFVMILCLVFANHYIACGWYWIGTRDNLHTWLEKSDITERNTAFKYTTALHWSLTQFTPASMDVSATNTPERIYSIVVLLFALVTFTSFVSSITTSMTDLRKMRSEPQRQQALLREYFYTNNLTAELGQRVWKYLWANHFSIKKRLHEQDVSILSVLPEVLRWKIREELHQPVLTGMPFLAEYYSRNVAGVHELCHHAVTELTLMTGDEGFSRGTWATKVFLITGGSLQYNCHVIQQVVKNGDWVCEPALWTEWSHVGALTASTTAEITCLAVARFWEIVGRHSSGRDFVETYKHKFLAYAETEQTSDLTTLPVNLFLAARSSI